MVGGGGLIQKAMHCVRGSSVTNSLTVKSNTGQPLFSLFMATWSEANALSQQT